MQRMLARFLARNMPAGSIDYVIVAAVITVAILVLVGNLGLFGR